MARLQWWIGGVTAKERHGPCRGTPNWRATGRWLAPAILQAKISPGDIERRLTRFNSGWARWRCGGAAAPWRGQSRSRASLWTPRSGDPLLPVSRPVTPLSDIATCGAAPASGPEPLQIFQIGDLTPPHSCGGVSAIVMRPCRFRPRPQRPRLPAGSVGATSIPRGVFLPPRRAPPS